MTPVPHNLNKVNLSKARFENQVKMQKPGYLYISVNMALTMKVFNCLQCFLQDSCNDRLIETIRKSSFHDVQTWSTCQIRHHYPQILVHHERAVCLNHIRMADQAHRHCFSTNVILKTTDNWALSIRNSCTFYRIINYGWSVTFVLLKNTNLVQMSKCLYKHKALNFITKQAHSCIQILFYSAAAFIDISSFMPEIKPAAFTQWPWKDPNFRSDHRSIITTIHEEAQHDPSTFLYPSSSTLLPIALIIGISSFMPEIEPAAFTQWPWKDPDIGSDHKSIITAIHEEAQPDPSTFLYPTSSTLLLALTTGISSRLSQASYLKSVSAAFMQWPWNRSDFGYNNKSIVTTIHTKKHNLAWGHSCIQDLLLFSLH